MLVVGCIILYSKYMQNAKANAHHCCLTAVEYPPLHDDIWSKRCH